LPNIEIKVSSGFSTNLPGDLQRGKLDVAFLRREPEPDLEYRLVRKERLVIILSSDHRLAKNTAINPHDLSENAFIGISEVAPVLRAAIRDYMKRSGVEIVPAVEIDNFSMAISLVTSTGGVAMLPESINGYLPPSITSRPVVGDRPTVGLVLRYHKLNTSPILKSFLSKIDVLAGRIY
jgi:LysR family hca operon transcriptional activator